MRIANEVTPLEFMKEGIWWTSLHEVLTKSIYHLLSEKCGVVNSPVRKAHSSPQQRAETAVKENEAVKERLQRCKKDNAPTDVIDDLAEQYHINMSDKIT